MGSCFTFLPQEGILAPKKLQDICISFCPTILGEFQEQFRFHVTGSPEPVTLTIRGCVVGPTLLFDVPALHFGDVSFGFPHTLKCRLSNASLAHVPVELHIVGDGLGECSVDSFAQMGRDSNRLWRKGARGSVGPREFAVSPCRTTVRALGSRLFKITLCSNTAREYKLELVVDVIGVGLKWLTLPLTARCMLPALRVLDPVVWFNHCCLKFPYEEKVTLVNDSDFRGCYRLLSQ
ncbi:PREDICTED: hydrocephalus-inducing protein homolog, partial [Ficedula albicollis]|uniref:hydrocephalus-inducing protein homolog n=1 Tax=Ficedula albicollis TaxID=59894 RepID=UPI0003598069